MHSPFVYKLIEDVIYDETPYNIYTEIECIRAELLKNNSEIKINDFGAGSRISKSNKRKISAIAKASVKPKKFSQLLFRLINHFKPENILELGTSLGITTLYLASADSKKAVTTIEGCPEIARIATDNFNKKNAKNIIQIIGNFDDVLPDYLKKIQTLDFVFIDGNHLKEPTIRYFNWCLEKTHHSTVLIFDDIHWSKDMEETWEIIKANEKVKVTIDLFYMGLVFFRKEQPKEHFKIRY